MRRRNREINIFSMSALDLFASALGAFILIAIVIFPYFPNTGRATTVTPPPAEEIRARLEEVESQLAESQGRLANAGQDARELEEIRSRLAESEARLAEAGEREARLGEALAEERRRQFLLVTISWEESDDVDLHVVDPRGNEYYYASRQHGGSPAQFEEDTIHGPGNEVWLHPLVDPGGYAVSYTHFSGSSDVVAVRGSVVHSHGREELPTINLLREDERRQVATVVVDGDGNVDVR
ncbi:MAG: hypothetical protein J4F30_03915 [Acidobacteria bacterium]|nr:hypothetical protein [Acidobacteriota bacterium]